MSDDIVKELRDIQWVIESGAEELALMYTVSASLRVKLGLQGAEIKRLKAEIDLLRHPPEPEPGVALPLDHILDETE